MQYKELIDFWAKEVGMPVQTGRNELDDIPLPFNLIMINFYVKGDFSLQYLSDKNGFGFTSLFRNRRLSEINSVVVQRRCPACNDFHADLPQASVDSVVFPRFCWEYFYKLGEISQQLDHLETIQFHAAADRIQNHLLLAFTEQVKIKGLLR